MASDEGDAYEIKLPTITPRKSHRGVNSGDGMMEILVDDINRYEALAEREQMLVLQDLFAGQVGEHTEIHELQTVNLPSDIQLDPQHNTRYQQISLEETENFIHENRNKNTSLKTKSDIKLFTDWCHNMMFDRRNIEDIPSLELDALLARFYLSVRRRDGNEYEPDTLTGVMNSIDRYLKDQKKTIDLKKDEAFTHSRRVLEAKRKALKSQGKGNKKQKAESLETDEITSMYKKQLLGAGNPTSLLNTVWLNNGVFFGFRGRQEHTSLLLGDLKFRHDTNGLEFVEFNERSTKTRNGAKSGDQRPVTPRMFAQPDNDYCPVKMLKTYISKRPEDMREDPTSRFYLRPLNTSSGDVWYSHQPVGKNKLGTMMKNLAEQAEIMGRKVNHSTRKTFASALLQNDRPNTEVAQLGGWKNVGTLTHYNIPSFKQQNNASRIIAETIIPQVNLNDENKENLDNEPNNNEPNVDQLNFIADEATDTDVIQTIQTDHTKDELDTALEIFSQSNSKTITSNSAMKKETNPFSILCGATITGGVINLNIYSGKRKHDHVDSSQE